MNNNDESGLFLQQNAADTLMRNFSTRQVLSNMGFPDSRALKAIVATGDAGVQVACDWIFAHLHDPHLNEVSSREYILYACPTGPLANALDEFWQQSLIGCGRNGVHNSFPHVTLCSFFKCEDENVSQLVRCVRLACERVMSQPGQPKKIELEYFSTSNYVGLFLQDESASVLWKLSDFFAEEAKTNANTVVEPHSNKQLHVTLAYKFLPAQLHKLEKLARKIELSKASAWEIRLYSRDSLFNGCETLRVLYPRARTATTSTTDGGGDHLQLINGDYVFVKPEENNKLADGWYRGTSWMTGCSGRFPVSHTELAVDTDTWTMHKKYLMTSSSNSSGNKGGRGAKKLTRKYSRGADEFHCSSPQAFQAMEKLDESAPPSSKSKNNGDEGEGSDEASCSSSVQKKADTSQVYAQVNKPRGIRAVVKKVGSNHSRRIYIFRHAERVDVTFGKQWLNHSFDAEGNYYRNNLNMPFRIPKRAGAPHTFLNDTPITEMGMHQAFLNGQAMRQAGVNISHAFSSPSLRSVQTCNGILTGLGLEKSVAINLELDLFEWMKWCHGSLPQFVTKETFEDFNINISPTYESAAKAADLKKDERCEHYFNRSFRFMQRMLQQTTGDVLIVGHAGSLDVLTRQLQGFNARPMTQFVGIVTKVPYCASVVIEEVGAGVYQLVKPPYPSLTHSPNPMFDWQQLLK